MQCKCGGITTEQTHEVKTLKKAIEWFDDAREKELPLKIHQNKCSSCGRLHYMVQNNQLKIVKIFN